MRVSDRWGIPIDAALLAFGMFLAVSAGNILTPLLSVIQDEFGVSYSSAGLMVSAYGFARLALDLPAGFLQERLGARNLSVLAFVLLGSGAVLAMVSRTFTVLVGARVGMGLGASILSVVVLTALSDLAPDDARGRVLALYTMANNSAISIFPIVGGIMGTLWGWRSTMGLVALLSVLSGVLMVRIVSRVESRPQPSRKGAAAAASDGAFRFSPAIALAMGTLYFGVMINMINRHGFRNTVLPLFARDELGLNPVEIATGITLIAIMGLIMAMPGGILGDRWGRRGVISAGFVVLALGDFAFLNANGYLSFLFAAFVLGFGDFFSASQAAGLTDVVPARLRSRTLGIYRFSVDLGAAIGPFALASLVGVSGYQFTLTVAIFLMLSAAIVVQLGRLAGVPKPETVAAGTAGASPGASKSR